MQSPGVGCSLIDFRSFSARLCVDCLQLYLVSFLSYRIKRFEDLWFKSFSCSNFSNAFTKDSVKYLLGYKLFFDPNFVVDLTRSLASTV
jgi:hypothetical protein